jgi:hypothetical protein
MGLFDNAKQQREQIKNKKSEFKEKQKNGGPAVGVDTVKYLGGHPDIRNEVDGLMVVNSAGIFFEVTLTFFNLHIPVENIIKAEFKTEEQISKDVTLGRLLVFGVFAFGMKKKKVEKLSYLVLTYTDSGIENTIVFTNKNAGPLASAIMKVRQQYAALNPITEAAVTSDIPDQIRKFSELKDQGILTEEEFQQKKTDLLSRI